ncbi:MAG: hypothetical protein KatS3mg110_4502 [Pirellulaceae bacterium]|nr:MAG: hypothetical protein KatS3mg110_4502 [Pirellulaceae bacterium]
MMGLWTWFFLLAAAQDVTASNEIERVLEIERKAVAARQAIERGQYRMKQKTLNGLGKVSKESEYWIVFDTNRLRVDRRLQIQGSGIPIEKKFVVDNRRYILFERSLQSDFRTAVNITNKLSPVVERHILEPRIIGMMQLPLVGGKIPLNVCVAADSTERWLRTSARMYREKIDGHDAIVTEHVLGGTELPEGGVRTIWIVPDLGYSVVKMEFRGNVRNQLLLDRLQVRVKAFEGDRGTVWFPEWARTERHLSGGLSHAFEVEIWDAQFNKPVDPNLFTLGGMDIPPETSVHDNITGRAYKWDGKQLIERYVGDRWWREDQEKLKALGDKVSSVWSSDEVAKLFTEPAKPKIPSRWVEWCTAAVLGLMGIVCLGIGTRRWIKQRATKCSPVTKT